MDNNQINIPNFSQTSQNSNINSQNFQQSRQKPQGMVPMIVSIVMFCLACVFGGLTLYFLMKLINLEDEAKTIFWFFMFLFTYSWLTFITAFICSVAGVCTAGFGSKSNSKAIKITSIIFLILNILMLIAVLTLAIIVIILPTTF